MREEKAPATRRRAGPMRRLLKSGRRSRVQTTEGNLCKEAPIRLHLKVLKLASQLQVVARS